MDGKKKRTIKYGVQMQFLTLFLAFVMGLLIFLNSYPLLKSRDLVFASKESALQGRASVAAASLSALETLRRDSVGQVMALLDITDLTRVLITDGDGTVLYDDYGGTRQVGQSTDIQEVLTALSGETIFRSEFADGAFSSTAAQPIRSRGVTIGAVYLYELDEVQGELLLQLQRTIRNISFIVAAVALLILTAVTRALTMRLTDLVRAIRIVSSGAYDYRMPIRGGDEITELGEEFNRMTATLQETDQLRRRFVSDASHELKTPLASIRLLSDSIAQSDNMDADTMREFVSDIGSEAERLQRTTDKLLSLTRLDAGAPNTVREPVDLAETAENILRRIRPLADKQEVTLTEHLEKECFVLANGDDLYQAIFNLVENAIKYNNPGGSVELTVCREDGEIVVLVEDTGIGIPEEDLPHIFSRFYRVDKARSRASGGSGLGLSIVKDAVELHGGRVSVQQRREGGSRFMLRFPANDNV